MANDNLHLDDMSADERAARLLITPSSLQALSLEDVFMARYAPDGAIVRIADR